MKVKEYNYAHCRVEIHDDYIVDEKEKEKILKKSGRLVSSFLEKKLKDKD